MKKNYTYILGSLVLLVLTISGCVKSEPAVTVPIPAGNFVGTFMRIHINPVTNKRDTINANLTIAMSVATGYAVTGDTTKHAGSHGSYVVDGVNIAFYDQTLPATSTTPPAKTHLNGVYQYGYAPPVLQIGFQNDTLSYFYNLIAK